MQRKLLLMLVILMGTTVLVPIIAAQTDEDNNPVARVIAWRLNARAAPTTDSEVVAVLEYDQVYAIVGRTPTAEWLQIQLTATQTAWVASRFTEETISAELPVLDVDLPEQVNRVQVIQDVNVRAGAGTNFPRINGLPTGTTVTVIGRNGDGTWAQIEQPNGATGWIFDGALPDSFDLMPLPVPASALLGAQWRTVNTVAVRLGPENFYPLVEFLPAGSLVTILGRDTTSQWVKIGFPISNGWIPATAFPEGTDVSGLPLSLRLISP